MIRALRNTAAVLAAAALVSLPATATATAADYGGSGTPAVVVNNVNQLALGDIFNARHDNTVGSNNGAVDMPGVGSGVGSVQPGSTTVTIATGGIPPLTLLYGNNGDWPQTLRQNQLPQSFPVTGIASAIYEDPGHGRVRFVVDTFADDAPLCAVTSFAVRDCRTGFGAPFGGPWISLG